MQYLSEQEMFRTWFTQPHLEKQVITNLGLTNSFRCEGVDVKEGIELLKPKVGTDTWPSM